MINRSRLAAGVLCLAATLATGLPPVAATAAADEPGTAQTTPKVELVLDVSGSMRARDVDGQSRMAAAKQAFNEVLDAVPDDVQLGIRTLGATYPGDDKTIGCKDSRQLFPVGPVNSATRTEAKTAVATLTPTGWTPIGLALQGAAKDLGGGDGSRRIVLITDGEDTCTNPCDVARQLAAQGTQLTVDTLGLVPNAGIREQLGCIAAATGGTYTAVEHTDQLSSRVRQLVNRTADTTVTPTATEGANTCQAAPLLGAGVYSDREEFAQHRWYRVSVRDGQELRASASIGADRQVNNDYGVLLRAVTTGGRELVRGSDAGSGRTDVMSAGLRYAWAEKDDPAARTVCLELSNSFSAPSGTRTSPGPPVELTVDIVSAPDNASDVASLGLGKGWVLLLVLALTGLLFGLLWGWLSRWRVSVWRTN
jgi:Ca-activated chloride channel family protein